MKKQCVTFWLGVVVGVIAMLCIVIMWEALSQKDVDEFTASSHTTESYETTSNEKTEGTSDAKKEEYFLNYEVADTDNTRSDVMQSQKSESIRLRDENGEFTPEALALAQEYLSKLENDEWNGYSVLDSGIEVGEFCGMITLNSEETQVRTDERIICDNAIESYMSGEWDGTEKQLSNGHTIKLKVGEGYLLLDGCYIEVGQENLDLPEYAYDLIYDNIGNYAYVPGEGTYTIIDSKLVKFLRGEQVELPGDKLSWKGFKSPNDIRAKMGSDSSCSMYDSPTLIYNKIDGKLYLTTGDKTCTLNNSINYLYVFDDYNKSEMRYIGKIDFEHEYPGNIDMSKVKFVKK